MIIPFRLSKKPPYFLKNLSILTLLIALSAALSYFFIDLPLTEFFHSHFPPLLSLPVQFITDLISPLIQAFFWPILYFLFRFVWHRKKEANICLLALLSIALSNGVIEILKRLVGRARPELWWNQHFFGFLPLEWQDLFLSFPSGHAGTVGALVGVFAALFPRYRYLWLFLGVISAFTRVVLGMHYLSDIIAGLWIGICIGQKMYQIMKSEGIF